MIEILKTAALNTVQDKGRQGFRRYGIGPSGALDDLALSLGNAMVGNAEDAAGIEFQMFPARLCFHTDALIAITGAGCHATLNGQPVPAWWTLHVREGDLLDFLPPEKGARCYLAVCGGIDVPQVLGARATSTKSNFGGFEGRALREGDRLPIIQCAMPALRDPYGFGCCDPAVLLAVPPASSNPSELTIRMMAGAEYAQFDADSRSAIFNSAWKVTVQSNRQGYRLAGDFNLRLDQSIEMRSHGIVAGVVQVPPSGQPIVQLAEGNSAGGYPKIGNVITADLWRIGQAPPGTRMRFVECSLKQAQAAFSQLESYVAEVRRTAHWLRIQPKKAA